MAPSPTRFRKTRRTALIIAATGVTAALVVPPAVGGTGIGAIFNLGTTNTVNKPTVLTGANITRMLQVTNSGTGSALSLTTKAGVAPLRVSSKGKVANLNVDLLDGKDSSAFMAATARPDANTLDGKDSSAFAPATGQTLVTVAPGSWFALSTADGLVVENFSPYSRWKKSSTGISFIGAAPDQTSALNGRGLVWKGVEFCYTTSAGVQIDYLELNTFTSINGAGTRSLLLTDTTARTDSACRVYTLPTPVAITAKDGVNMFVGPTWTTANASFDIGRTTFIFDAAPTPLAPVSLSPLTTTTRSGQAQGAGTAPVR